MEAWGDCGLEDEPLDNGWVPHEKYASSFSDCHSYYDPYEYDDYQYESSIEDDEVEEDDDDNSCDILPKIRLRVVHRHPDLSPAQKTIILRGFTQWKELGEAIEDAEPDNVLSRILDKYPQLTRHQRRNLYSGVYPYNLNPFESALWFDISGEMMEEAKGTLATKG